ncbi:MAG: fatty acid desaturase [Myxococcota bacterium]|nr:fatty acid desaturase [Myxococcota bacterium]
MLEPPAYGFARDGRLYVPSRRELLGEFTARLNVLRSRKQWLPLWSWASSLALLPFLVAFLAHHFQFWLLGVGMIYSMVVLGTHGTIYLHRYCTHRAFSFTSPIWRFVCRNLVIKIASEELYVVSHHVHHRFAERPGDPYNAHGGWLYCFLADVNHQPIAKDLTQVEYRRVVRMLEHTGLRLNSYEQYLRWGSVTHPFTTVRQYVINWTFWYAVLFTLGGHALATAIFGASFLWAFGIRTFNFDSHGRGRDSQRAGNDFNRKDLSINQWWPGYVAGEWHNNHHLYPTSARSGFLPHQLDLAWCTIRACAWAGAVRQWRDNKADFYREHYKPYLDTQQSYLQRPSEN